MLFEDLVSTVKKQRKMKFKDFGRSEHYFSNQESIVGGVGWVGGGVGGFVMRIMSQRNGSDKVNNESTGRVVQ